MLLRESFEISLPGGAPARLLGAARSLARTLRALGRDLEALDVLEAAGAVVSAGLAST